MANWLPLEPGGGEKPGRDWKPTRLCFHPADNARRPAITLLMRFASRKRFLQKSIDFVSEFFHCGFRPVRRIRWGYGLRDRD